MFNTNTSEPLILSVGVGNTTRVVILKLNLETNRWTKLQSMHFKQDYIKYYVVKGNLYLIGCSSDAFCAIYKWINGQFRRHQKLSSQVMEKITDVRFKHDLVILEKFRNELSFFTSDDIINSQPASVRINPSNLADYTVYKSPINHRLFFAEFIFSKTSLAVNFQEIFVERIYEDVEKSKTQPSDPLECIAQLKSHLKNRITKVQSILQNVSVKRNVLCCLT